MMIDNEYRTNIQKNTKHSSNHFERINSAIINFDFYLTHHPSACRVSGLLSHLLREGGKRHEVTKLAYISVYRPTCHPSDQWVHIFHWLVTTNHLAWNPYTEIFANQEKSYLDLKSHNPKLII